MNFLALVNRARRECGISSAALTTFTSLSVEDTKIKEWVGEAWHDLQLHRPDWQWMRKPVSFATVAAQQTYTTAVIASDLAAWKLDSFRCYTTASSFADEQILPFMEYETYRNVYLFGSQRTTQTRPVVITVAPGTKNLMTGPLPDAGYTIVGEYYRTVTDLTATTDSPSDSGNGLDARWHMVLVYMAMRGYAAFEAAPEVWTRADFETRRLLSRLEADQMPPITFGPPLA
jgi:hypothetical protein